MCHLQEEFQQMQPITYPNAPHADTHMGEWPRRWPNSTLCLPVTASGWWTRGAHARPTHQGPQQTSHRKHAGENKSPSERNTVICPKTCAATWTSFHSHPPRQEEETPLPVPPSQPSTVWELCMPLLLTCYSSDCQGSQYKHKRAPGLRKERGSTGGSVWQSSNSFPTLQRIKLYFSLQAATGRTETKIGVSYGLTWRPIPHPSWRLRLTVNQAELVRVPQQICSSSRSACGLQSPFLWSKEPGLAQSEVWILPTMLACHPGHTWWASVFRTGDGHTQPHVVGQKDQHAI